MKISRIRLSDKTSRLHPRHVVPEYSSLYCHTTNRGQICLGRKFIITENPHVRELNRDQIIQITTNVTVRYDDPLRKRRRTTEFATNGIRNRSCSSSVNGVSLAALRRCSTFESTVTHTTLFPAFTSQI